MKKNFPVLVLILFLVQSQAVFSDPPRRIDGPSIIPPGSKGDALRNAAPPAVLITNPEENFLTNQSSITVTGTYANAQSVNVNGVQAVLTQGLFTASNVPLTEGANTLTATAIQTTSGFPARSATDTRHVTLDTIPPRLTVVSPQENFLTGNTSVIVEGTYEGANRISVQAANQNEVIASLAEGRFRAEGILLAHGQNVITVRASDGVNRTSREVRGVSDQTPPNIPSRPIEGWGADQGDLDWSYGFFGVFWQASSDSETAVDAYQIQERIGVTGEWGPSRDNGTRTSFYPPNLLPNTRYSYHVRARNTVGLWSDWSEASDGILLDDTNPLPVTVTDDGETTNSNTELHARWSESSDPESGISHYAYSIREGSPTGRVIVEQTVGLQTEILRRGLNLTENSVYYFEIRVYNRASRMSFGYSDGIRVVSQDTTPPTLNMNPTLAQRKAMTEKEYSFTAQALDSDPSPLEYQFELNRVVKQVYSARNVFTYTPASNESGNKTLTVKARDAGGEASQDIPIYIYRNPEGAS